MSKREFSARAPQDGQPRVVVIRRREESAPQPASVERKLQADVAAWLRERRATR
jgi:hypothetical protein